MNEKRTTPQVIITPATSTPPGFRLGKLFSAAAAVLLLGSSSVFALTGNQEIQAKLNTVAPGKNLNTANPEEIRRASLAAIATPAQRSTPIQNIVTAAVAKVPQFAADVARAGVDRIYNTPPPPGETRSRQLVRENRNNVAANLIMVAAMKKGLASYPTRRVGGRLVYALGANNHYTGLPARTPSNAVMTKADLAAAITLHAVNAAKNVTGTITPLNPVQTIVKGAIVQAGLIGGPGPFGGSAGVVAGAVTALAGQSNDDLTVVSPLDATQAKNNALIRVVLKTAAQAAPSRATQIAQAAGFAFANTFLQTISDTAVRGNGITFANKNAAAIVAAIRTGLSAAAGRALAGRLFAQVKAGINSAYNGQVNATSKGITFNNKIPAPVTPVTPP